jgi:hypothetical protein
MAMSDAPTLEKAMKLTCKAHRQTSPRYVLLWAHSRAKYDERIEALLGTAALDDRLSPVSNFLAWECGFRRGRRRVYRLVSRSGAAAFGSEHDRSGL